LLSNERKTRARISSKGQPHSLTTSSSWEPQLPPRIQSAFQADATLVMPRFFNKQRHTGAGRFAWSSAIQDHVRGPGVSCSCFSESSSGRQSAAAPHESYTDPPGWPFGCRRSTITISSAAVQQCASTDFRVNPRPSAIRGGTSRALANFPQQVNGHAR